MSLDLRERSRKTYSLVDLIADCGGLFSGLFTFGKFMAYPFSIFALRRKLAWNMVRMQKSSDEKIRRTTSKFTGGFNA